MTDTTSPKYVSESVVATFEFEDALGGQTISSIVGVDIAAAVGSDPSASSVLAGSPSISGTDVLQPVSGGVAGVAYLLTCTIQTSGGDTLVLELLLPVIARPAGIAPRPPQRWAVCGTVYTLENTVAPAMEPITLEEVKRWARIERDYHDEDDAIQALITAARVEAEHLCGGRAFIESTWRLSASTVPSEIVLPVSPLRSITSFEYTDDDGDVQTLAEDQYETDLAGGVPVVLPTYGVTWPSYRAGRSALALTFVAGFGAADAVPEPIKQWIRTRVATMYRDREAVAITRDQVQPLTYVDRMLDAYRVYSL